MFDTGDLQKIINQTYCLEKVEKVARSHHGMEKNGSLKQRREDLNKKKSGTKSRVETEAVKIEIAKITDEKKKKKNGNKIKKKGKKGDRSDKVKDKNAIGHGKFVDINV